MGDKKVQLKIKETKLNLEAQMKSTQQKIKETKLNLEAQIKNSKDKIIKEIKSKK